MQEYLDLAMLMLREFAAMTARFWPLFVILVVLHLVYALVTGVGTEDEEDLQSVVDVFKVFQDKGYKLEREVYQGRLGADYILSRLGGRTYLQVKWWNKAIGPRPIESAHQARKLSRCDFAIMVSRHGFTRSARQVADKYNVILIDLADLPWELDSFMGSIHQAMETAAATKSST